MTQEQKDFLKHMLSLLKREKEEAGYIQQEKIDKGGKDMTQEQKDFLRHMFLMRELGEKFENTK
jgi:hypothetical protein